MAHITNNKKLLARIRRIKGQVSAVENAFEDNSDCLSVLQQIAAIKGAVNGLMKEVLEDHMREHLGSENASTAQRQEELEQVIGVINSYLK